MIINANLLPNRILSINTNTKGIALRRSALQILNLYEWNIEGGKDKNLILYLGF